MKILYCDMQYDYGVCQNGPNFIGMSFQKAFQKNGCQVVTFYYDEFAQTAKPSPILQKLLLEKAEEVKPDLIFFSLFTHQFDFATLGQLKQRYTTAAWFGDDTWRFDDYSRLYAPHFSWCVTTDRFAVEKYRLQGQNNVITSQWAAIDDERPQPDFDGRFLYDVSFVGQFNRYRSWFVEKLVAAGFNVKCFGKGWKDGMLGIKEMKDVFLRSRINLNIANSICHDVRFLFSSPQALLRYFRSPKNMGQIKARNFEIPYYGGFQLTDYVPGIEDYFEIGREIACYKDVDEAILLVKYFLEHEKQRQEIAGAAHSKARLQHGYINRIKEILEIMRKTG